MKGSDGRREFTRSVTDSSLELSQVGWTSHPDASRGELPVNVQQVGDTGVDLHTEPREGFEQPTGIFAVFQPKPIILPAGLAVAHIVACKFSIVLQKCLIQQAFTPSALKSEMIKDSYRIRRPVNQVEFQVRPLFGHQKFLSERQNLGSSRITIMRSGILLRGFDPEAGN